MTGRSSGVGRIEELQKLEHRLPVVSDFEGIQSFLECRATASISQILPHLPF